jgi:hypothetical protein
LLIFFYKERDFNFYFIGSILIAGLLCTNQQVVSGKDLESWHWYYCTEKTIAIITGIVLLNNFLTKRANFLQRILKGLNYGRLKKPFLVSSFIFIILSGLYIQLSYYKSVKDSQKERQFLYSAFQWLNDNTEVDSVVLASEPVSLILPVYTHNNVYIARYIYESVVSDSEIMDRFFIFARLFGMDKEEITSYVINHINTFFGMRPGDPKYKSLEDFLISNKVLENITKKYEYFKKEDAFSLLRRFRVDYLFFSPYERNLSKMSPENYPFLHKVYDTKDIRIYKIMGKE